MFWGYSSRSSRYSYSSSYTATVYLSPTFGSSYYIPSAYRTTYPFAYYGNRSTKECIAGDLECINEFDKRKQLSGIICGAVIGGIVLITVIVFLIICAVAKCKR